jgi:hypothetical protein
MTVSGLSSVANLPSNPEPSQNRESDAQVALLKKAQDVAKQQGAAMIQMIEQIGPSKVGAPSGQLDTYA